MIQRVVAFALRVPSIVALLALAIVALGVMAYDSLDIEAYPNPVPPLVEVLAQPPGLGAEEVEQYVTRPLELGFAGIPGLEHVRSQSQFGLSDVKCYFRWGTRYQDARQEVINRLQFVQLPVAVQPVISPWNAVGEVYRYLVRGPGYSLTELKTIEDWTLERECKQVDGVIDVVSFGGLTRQYQIAVDPFRLRGHDVSLDTLLASVAASNANVGGQRLALGAQSYDVRGLGALRGKRDIEDVVLRTSNGTPIRVGHVASVTDDGFAPRLGSNEEAARIAGVNVKAQKILVYTISGGLAGLAGVVMSARATMAQPGMGLMYELDAISAAVIGGTSLLGGRGRISGTVIGVLILGVITSGFTFLRIDFYYQEIVKGLIILAAVIADQYRQGRQSGARRSA